jgi:carboxypeptidase Taq
MNQPQSKNNPQKSYQELHSISKEARILQGILSHLEWDQETYMPSGASGIRSEQIKTLAGLVHRKKTDKEYTQALEKLIDIPTGHLLHSDLTPAQKAALTEWRRDYLQDTALPSSFVEEFAQLSSQSVGAWQSAKKNNAFSQFAPYLDRIISLNRQKANYLGYQEHPYDALIDLYEPQMTANEISGLFTQLRQALIPLLKKINSSPMINDLFLTGEWDAKKQMEFGYKILDAMGYDHSKGRIDISSHPFSSSSHPTDSRITTRIHPTSLMSNIMVILHEGGHSLYEMGLPEDEYGTPLGEARSLGLHESQSRWWETRIGLSKPFWRHFLPILQETFAPELQIPSFDVFYKAINRVHPSLIRVEADEVTYPLHVILRFEMEKALIEGTLSIRDIPEAWNAKMKDLLGIVPPTNAEGCLQDIHWAMGSFGYFPTYTLGNLYAAHLFEGFAKQNSDWELQVAKGNFDFIRNWLNEHIYRYGRQFSSALLLEKATQTEFSVEPYLNYLTKKYSEIYRF